MWRSLMLATAGAALGFLAAGGAAAAEARRIPVILDTDIGGDIDDTWALAFLLRCPELDLRLVTTDHGDTVYRARIVARLLEVAGRTDVAVGVGLRQEERDGPQAEWVRGYDLGRYAGHVVEDGVQALIDAAMRSTEPMTLIAIGPCPNLRRALEREPGIAPKLRLAGMYGSLRRGYGGTPSAEPEWNVRADPAAARAVLAAPWRAIVLTPLDTCGVVRLDGALYARVRESKDPLVRALLENYRLWCSRQDGCSPESVAAGSSVLYDTVAVYLAMARDFVAMEELGVRVGDDGVTVPDASARPLLWATEWKDLAGFRRLLVDRLTGGPAGRQ
jgi:inosine-uridine nucleoside N-ribohydrolase